MRGIDKTKMIRAYVRDIVKMPRWIDELNRREPSGKKKTSADVLSLIFEENHRMKTRIAYLNYELCRLAAEAKRFEDTARKRIQV